MAASSSMDLRHGAQRRAGWVAGWGSAAVVVVACTVTSVAHAGPPMMTDDPGTPGPNLWEVNLATTLEYGPHDYNVEGPLLDMNYGIGQRVQVMASVPWVWGGSIGHAAKGSIGNPSIGVKVRILDQHDDGAFDLSVYPQADVNPIAAREYGLLDRGTEVLFPIQLAWTSGRWQIFGDLGFDWAIKAVSLVWGGVAGSVELDNDLTLLLEAHVEVPVDGSSVEVALNAGLTYEFNETFALLASAGTATWTGGPDLITYVGLQTHF
jgi:hypothetical protein